MRALPLAAPNRRLDVARPRPAEHGAVEGNKVGKADARQRNGTNVRVGYECIVDVRKGVKEKEGRGDGRSGELKSVQDAGDKQGRRTQEVEVRQRRPLGKAARETLCQEAKFEPVGRVFVTHTEDTVESDNSRGAALLAG